MSPTVRPLAAVTLIQAMLMMAAATVPVLAPDLAADSGLAARWIGVYLSLVFAGAMASIIVGGALTRRFGALAMTQVAAAIAAVGLLASATGAVWALAASALVIGFGYGLATPAASHILSRVTRPGRHRLVFSLKQSAVPLGGLLTGLIVPVVVLWANWQTAVVCIAVLVALAGLAIAPLRRRLDDDREPGLSLTDVMPWRAITFVLRHRALRVLAATAFTFAAAQVATTAIFVTYLVETASLSLVAAGAAFAVMQFTGMVTRVLLGWASDRLIGARTLLGLIGLAIAGALAALMLVSADWPVAAVFLTAAAVGVCVNGWAGIYLAEIARLVPQDQVATATGGTVFFSFLGSVIGPAAFSVIVLAGYAPGFAAIAAASGLVGLALLVTRARLNRA
jgi:MFS family permease